MRELIILAEGEARPHDAVLACRLDYRGQQPAPGQIPLPELDAGGCADEVAAFNEAVTRTAQIMRGRLGWQYSWLSSRDIHSSPTQRQYLWICRLDALLSDPEAPRRVTVACRTAAEVAAAAAVGRKHGRHIRGAAFARPTRWLFRARDLARPWMHLTNELRRWRIAIATARRHKVAADKTRGKDAVLVSLLDQTVARSDNGPYEDTYLGKLPQHLERSGESVLVCGPAYGDLRESTQRVADSPHPLTTFAHFLGWGDLFRQLVRALSLWREARRSLHRLTTSPALHRLVAADLRDGVGSILQGCLCETAFARILARNPGCRIIMMYENSPWQIAILQATKSRSRHIDTTGFLHCAVLPAHLKNFKPADDEFRNTPDRIVCTGLGSRDVYLALGAHKGDAVLAGCDLRGSKPLPAARTGPPGRIRNILVLLQGDYSMVHLVKFLDHAARCLKDRRILLRAHPKETPLPFIIKETGVDISPGRPLAPAAAESLEDALAGADAVLYKATTAVFAALKMGVPAIHYEDDWWLSDDPLFQLDALKWTIRSPDELEGICSEIEAMSPSVYREQRQVAERYVDRYNTAYSPDGTAAFLPQTPIGPRPEA